MGAVDKRPGKRLPFKTPKAIVDRKRAERAQKRDMPLIFFCVWRLQGRALVVRGLANGDAGSSRCGLMEMPFSAFRSWAQVLTAFGFATG
jgi:hypothetical protein